MVGPEGVVAQNPYLTENLREFRTCDEVSSYVLEAPAIFSSHY